MHRSHGVTTLVAATFGVVYVFIGLAGFLVTGGRGWVDPAAGESLAGFAVNPLHNVVHVAVGALLLLGSLSVPTARAVCGLVGVVYLALGVLGLFIASPSNAINVLALNGFDNVLHLATALLLLGVAGTFDRGRAPVAA